MMNANDGPAPTDYDAPSRKQLEGEGDSDGLVPPKKIAHLQFGLMSAEEIQRITEFQVSVLSSKQWDCQEDIGSADHENYS
jgi:hypothetical protein